MKASLVELKTRLLNEVEGYDVVNNLADHIFIKYGRKPSNLMHLIRIEIVTDGTNKVVVHHNGMVPAFQNRVVHLTEESCSALYALYNISRSIKSSSRHTIFLDRLIEMIDDEKP